MTGPELVAVGVLMTSIVTVVTLITGSILAGLLVLGIVNLLALRRR